MSFEERLNRIKPRLRAISRRLQRKYILLSEQDLYQEAALHLWDESRKNALCDKTESYVLQGCYFFLKNYIRTHYTRIERQSLPLETAADSHDRLPDILSKLAADEYGSSRAHDRIEVASLKEAVQKCLLPREEEILSCYLGGFTTREIGKRMGISHVRVVKIGKAIRDKCKSIREEAFC